MIAARAESRGQWRRRAAVALRALRWVPRYAAQRLTRSARRRSPGHLIIAVADHFEPAILPGVPGGYADPAEQERRLERWCREYPRAVDPWRDHDGRPLRHTYFYPAEQYDKALIDRLAEHCRDGWGEVEIHLHHGVDAPDTPANTRRRLQEFAASLVARGCLSRWNGVGPARYAFVHGNWALANSAGGACCGVDQEMQVLAETGCYADMTLPAAPHPAQVGKTNALYECALPLDQRAPHRRGRDLRVGQPPRIFPLIVQGPLGIALRRGDSGRPGRPYIENGEITARLPLAMARLRHWLRLPVTVRGRPEWAFLKLHCHGMDPRDATAMHGETLQRFLRDLSAEARASGRYRVHYVTAREMVNIILAACDGRDGNPGDYRDYRLQPVTLAPTA